MSPKRDEILDAATAAFRDDGYDATSMDRIAALAGASKRTVYNHFGSKEALFEAVIARLFERAEASKRLRWDPRRSIEAQLTDFARSKSLLADDPDWAALLRVVLGVLLHNPALAHETLRRSAESERGLVQWLVAADAAGKVRVRDPDRAAALFWAMASGALFWPQVFQGPMPKTERDRVTKDVVTTFLARYRAP